MRPSNLHPIFLRLGQCGWSHVSSCDIRLPEIPGIPGVQAQVSSALGYCQPHHRILQRGVRGGLFYSLDPTSPSVLLQQSGNPPCIWGLCPFIHWSHSYFLFLWLECQVVTVGILPEGGRKGEMAIVCLSSQKSQKLRKSLSSCHGRKTRM